MRLLGYLALFKVINKAEILLDGHIKVKGRQLGEIAYLLLCGCGIVQNVYPVDEHLSVGGGNVACEDIHGCGFTCAVGAEKAQYLAVIYGKRDIVQSFFAAVMLGKVFNLDHYSHSSP